MHEMNSLMRRKYNCAGVSDSHYLSISVWSEKTRLGQVLPGSNKVQHMFTQPNDNQID